MYELEHWFEIAQWADNSQAQKIELRNILQKNHPIAEHLSLLTNENLEITIHWRDVRNTLFLLTVILDLENSFTFY